MVELLTEALPFWLHSACTRTHGFAKPMHVSPSPPLCHSNLLDQQKGSSLVNDDQSLSDGSEERFMMKEKLQGVRATLDELSVEPGGAMATGCHTSGYHKILIQKGFLMIQNWGVGPFQRPTSHQAPQRSTTHTSGRGSSRAC